MKYIIITPAKNEEKYIPELINSVRKSSIKPYKWFIVDDNSTDRTPAIIKEASVEEAYIIPIIIGDKVERTIHTGKKVGQIFNYVCDTFVKELEYDFLIKFDADIKFDDKFIENIFNEFVKNPRLGIASGNLFYNNKPEKIPEEYTTRGATMIFSKKCWEQIGGLIPYRGEDTLAAIKARALGWETKSFNFRFDHLKPEGAKNSNVFLNWETGLYKGAIPYYLPYYLVTLVKDAFLIKPYIISSIIQFFGYLYMRVQINNRFIPEIIHKQLKKEQIIRLKKYFRVSALFSLLSFFE